MRRILRFSPGIKGAKHSGQSVMSATEAGEKRECEGMQKLHEMIWEGATGLCESRDACGRE